MNLPLNVLSGRRHSLSGVATKAFLLSLDLLAALLAFFFALLITNNFAMAKAGNFFVLGWAPIILLSLRGISFVLFRTYLVMIRYIGVRDVKNVFFAVTSSTLAFCAAVYFWPGLLPKKEAVSIILVDYILLLGITNGMRVGIRLFMDYLRTRAQSSHLNTVIFGAGEMGALLHNVLRQNVSHDYRVMAFFDDNMTVNRRFLHGIRVFNTERHFKEVIKRYDIKVAIIAIGELSEDRRVAFINKCLEHHVKVMKVPTTESWIHNKLDLGQLRDIRFEDLLNRPPIQLDNQAISASVRGRCVVVTGCAGSIGREIVCQLLKYEPREIIGIDIAETPMADVNLALQQEIQDGTFLPVLGDVRDYDRMELLFETYQPDYVFHAAAYKHVPIMEQFPEEAIKANVLGTKNIADLAAEYQADKFVMISTDKVINPSNVMGASKRIAEIYVQALNYQTGNTTRFITTRFGNVLGSNGSVIPIFRQQIQRRQPVTVTHPEVRRFFMTIPEACQLVLEAGAMGKGGEIYIFDMGEPVKIVDLARRMIQMAGLTPGEDIKIVHTGLRPGEKLYEELFDKDENNKETYHPKIKIASVRPCADTRYFESTIQQLILAARQGAPKEEIVGLMKDLVPEFTSQNSEFSALDKARKEAVTVRKEA